MFYTDIRQQQAQIIEKITAFACFKNRGIAVAERRYPDFVDFFVMNKDKSIDEVERQLMQTLPAKVHN